MLDLFASAAKALLLVMVVMGLMNFLSSQGIEASSIVASTFEHPLAKTGLLGILVIGGGAYFIAKS